MKLFFLFYLFTSIAFSQDEQKLNLLTYNTGLALNYVRYSNERAPFIVDYLIKTEADVICLQEVWSKKDQELIRRGLRNRYPYSFIPDSEQHYTKNTPSCGFSDLVGDNKILSCIYDKCINESGEGLSSCVTNKCHSVLDGLTKSNRECAGAFMAQVGKNPIVGILSLLNPFRSAEMFAYGGQSGLMMFSKTEIKDAKFYDLAQMSTLNRRGFIHAEINLNQSHHFFCTHLTANFDYTLPYPGVFNSWEDENIKQVNKLVSISKMINGPVYLMGDFNCSMKDDSNLVDGENEKSCHTILENGFTSPITNAQKGCSFCPGNTLVDEIRPKGFLIDHIFIKDNESYNAKILLNEPIHLFDKEGKPISSHLSDHYGVGLEIKK